MQWRRKELAILPHYLLAVLILRYHDKLQLILRPRNEAVRMIRGLATWFTREELWFVPEICTVERRNKTSAQVVCGRAGVNDRSELHALYSSPDIIRNIKSRRLRWAGHVARMGESRNAYRVLVGRPEGKRPLGRPRRRWEDNIKMDLKEVGYDDRDWINLAQNRDQWRAYVRAAMNLRVP
ncbi:hypothetical protein ANN_08005 [Periplaneta americana]|uniref:Endonuclease-reverse transcriptase n=1 Tax=Periplaneta americana TaxID=6978 RepID=A0ABQ8T1L0_PERAM|nr:hypothetical protein ANN_08005 [Periplaneta americana]